jgi:hypothetical protein
MLRSNVILRAPLFAALFICAGRAPAQQPIDTARVLSTGIAGHLTASGLESPTYVLSFPAVQRLVLEMVESPVASIRATELLRGTPVTIGDLVRLGLIRLDAGRYRINYLVLTTEDQRRIYQVAERYGNSLARAVRTRQDSIDRLVSAYPRVDLRDQVKFVLVAGMLLNWEGLKLSTRLGYRAEPRRFSNGDEYLVHSNERGLELPMTGLYLGSEGWPAEAATVTTFGDPESFPRARGLPNVFDPVFDGLTPLENSPVLYAASRQQLLTYLGLSVADVGEIMLVLRDRAVSRKELGARVNLPADRMDAALKLLLAIDYVSVRGDTLRADVPVLSLADQELVNATLGLGRDILGRWLRDNVDSMKHDLGDLSPLKNGMPFNLVFGEVWHYVFGFATKDLAESGFYVNPRAPGWPYPGYVPVVWATRLYKF